MGTRRNKMKAKTNELTGAALDWAVAKAENLTNWDDDRLCFINVPHGEDFEPSTNWAQGGSIIERERLELFYLEEDEYGKPLPEPVWFCELAKLYARNVHASGDTPLIAAMRCYVASKLGDEVDLPEELK
jgi:hypothetical protein